MVGIVNIDDFYKLTPFEFECLKLGALNARLLPQTIIQPVSMLETEGYEKLNEHINQLIHTQESKIHSLFEKAEEETEKIDLFMKHFSLLREEG